MTEEEPLLSQRQSLNSLNSSMMRFRLLLQKLDEPRPHCDECDWSRHPSYTGTKLPYSLICEYRYKDNCKKYERQFQHEIAHLIMAHTSAYEAMRIHTHMAISTLWPPLHSRVEQQHTASTFYKLTPSQKERLHRLMTTKII